MLLIDDLLLGGLRFVLDKLATVVDQEMNDESRLHQTLMEAQMRFEMGEISAEEFAASNAPSSIASAKSAPSVKRTLLR